ncbi:MAG: YbaB/EbfC family nucleoid-associated protein [Bacteroidetes bacterium]|nr:YbaB/EbfC family nucleoid-associated protein [Bacteroidota bacterium]
MFEQLNQMKQQMADLQSKMDEMRVSASAGDGLVTAEANGNGRITNLILDDDWFKSCEAEEAAELIQVAVNRAIEAASEKHASEMRNLAGGMMPGMF